MPFPLINPKITFTDNDGVPLVSGTVEFRDPATDLPKSTYPTANDAAGPSNPNPDVISLNARGEAPNGIFLIDGESYKMELFDNSTPPVSQYVVDDIESPTGGTAGAISITDSGGYYVGTNVEDALQNLGSTGSGQGASIIGLNDAGSNYAAADVEAALLELTSTATGEGASIIGIRDTANLFTSTNVEDTLAELHLGGLGTTLFKGVTTSRSTDIVLSDDPELAGWALDGSSRYTITGRLIVFQNIGNFQFRFQLSQSASGASLTWDSLDETGVAVENFVLSVTTGQDITTMTDSEQYSIILTGSFLANVAASTMDFQWAQETSSANNTNLIAGSWIAIKKLD